MAGRPCESRDYPSAVGGVLSITLLSAKEKREAKPPPIEELERPPELCAPNPILLYPNEGP